MNAWYAHVSPISPPISDIRYEKPHPIWLRYPIFRTLCNTITVAIERYLRLHAHGVGTHPHTAVIGIVLPFIGNKLLLLIVQKISWLSTDVGITWSNFSFFKAISRLEFYLYQCCSVNHVCILLPQKNIWPLCGCFFLLFLYLLLFLVVLYMSKECSPFSLISVKILINFRYWRHLICNNVQFIFFVVDRSTGVQKILNQLDRFWKDLKMLLMEKVYVINVLGIASHFLSYIWLSYLFWIVLSFFLWLVFKTIDWKGSQMITMIAGCRVEEVH